MFLAIQLSKRPLLDLTKKLNTVAMEHRKASRSRKRRRKLIRNLRMKNSSKMKDEVKLGFEDGNSKSELVSIPSY